MFLACDIGNSRIKTGLFDGRAIKEIKTFQDSGELRGYIDGLGSISSALSSVVPSKTEEILRTAYAGGSPFVITKESKFNLKIDYDTPETLGIDRLCSAEGAYSLYINSGNGAHYNKNIILISVDFGTATTINVIKYPGIFAGGLIAPGLGTMLNSLHKETAQLPLVNSSEFTGLIGRSTKGSIASGVINSAAGLLQKTIEELKRNEAAEEVYVYATGGNAKYILPHLSFETFFEEGLVLRGIKSVYEANVR